VGGQEVEGGLGAFHVGNGFGGLEEKLVGVGGEGKGIPQDAEGGGEVAGGDDGGLGVVEGDKGVVGLESADASVERGRGAPVGELAEGEDNLRDEDNAKENAECRMQNAGWRKKAGRGGTRFSGAAGGHAPREWKESEKGDGEPEGGDVGKAVGDGVVGNGDESGDGEEEQEKPQDAEGGEGTGAADADGKEEEGGEEDGVKDRGDGGEVRTGVKRGEMKRKEGEMEIVGASLGEVEDAGGEREGQTGLAVSCEGGNGGGGSEEKVGDFGEDESQGERAPEDKEVKEDEKNRKRDKGGFDEEGGCKEEKREALAHRVAGKSEK
jgi:transcription termination factor Rho